MRRTWVAVLLGVSSWFSAHAASDVPVRSIAVFPLIARGKVDKTGQRNVQDAIERGLATNPVVSVIGPARLRQALRRNLVSALQTCGSDLGCIANLGKSVGVQSVM